MKEALYYSSIDEKIKKVQCLLCPHQCIIEEGKVGICGTRKNENGKLYAVVYDRFVSVNLDPIEKKPLYHFYPDTQILSLGTVGCNLRCRFCQNFEISQVSIENVPARTVIPDDAVRISEQYNSIGIAYTYNEPLINFEYILETASKAAKQGLKNVLVTNGFLNERPLMELLPYIDGANIDVKSFRDNFYRKYCSGRLKDVLRTVEIMNEQNKHIELTNLIIPGLNDSEEEINDLTDWICSLSDEIPLHFSRYHPCYKMTIPSTPLSTLERARSISSKKLKFVYLGNVWEKSRSDTCCPECGQTLIERRGYQTRILAVRKGKCTKCGKKINIVQ